MVNENLNILGNLENYREAIIPVATITELITPKKTRFSFFCFLSSNLTLDIKLFISTLLKILGLMEI